MIKNNKNIQSLLLTALIVIGLAAELYQQSYDELIGSKVSSYINQADKSFEQTEGFILSEYKQALNINHLMAQSQTFLDYINTPSEENRKQLTDAWQKSANQQSLFKQIRYLDISGQELIRINSDHVKDTLSGFFNIGNSLPNKAHRDYFTYAKTLKEGSIGVFGVDLEQENSQYLIPYTPALRIIIPIFIDTIPQGFMITNYNIADILSVITYEKNKNAIPEIIDNNGSYIIAKNEKHEFGDQLAERAQYNLPNKHPKLWEKINHYVSGYYYNKKDLYLFHTIDFNYKRDNNELILLKTIPSSQIKKELSDSINALRIRYVLWVIGLLSLLAIYLYKIKADKRRMEYDLVNTALHNASAIVITDENYTILKVNQEFIKQSRYSEPELVDKTIEEVCTKENHALFINTIKPAVKKHNFWQGDLKTFDKEGNPTDHLLRIQTIENSHARYIFSLTDITHHKKVEAELKEYSEKDALTGCWNRRLFDLTLKKETALVQRYGNHYKSCLALLDLDHFKKVNDQYGHQRGDEVLRSVAQIFRDSFRETDFIARVGGEEFAIILPHITIKDAYIVLERLRETIEDYFDIRVTVSGGVVEFAAETSEEELYKACDVLLYQAKNNGRNRIAQPSEEE